MSSGLERKRRLCDPPEIPTDTEDIPHVCPRCRHANSLEAKQCSNCGRVMLTSMTMILAMFGFALLTLPFSYGAYAALPGVGSVTVVNATVPLLLTLAMLTSPTFAVAGVVGWIRRSREINR